MNLDNMNTNKTFTLAHALLVLSLSVLLTGALIAASQVAKAAWELEASKAQTKTQAVKNCFDIARGTRTTSGSTANENWQLSQVDLNYEVISKCLGEVDVQ